MKRRKVKGKGEKKRYIHLNAEYQRMHGQIRKPSSVINANREQQNGKELEISARKLEIPREHFMQRWVR